MINGLGILGWGVGGIEAEAAMLGQPLSMLIPEVVGFRLTGKLPEGSTATDLVLRITQICAKHGVVGKFVEFHGSGLAEMPVANRATIGNMAPEYGATVGFFPVDGGTRLPAAHRSRREPDRDRREYYREQGLWRGGRHHVQRRRLPRPGHGGAVARRPYPSPGPGFALGDEDSWESDLAGRFARPQAGRQEQGTVAVLERTGVETTLDGATFDLDNGEVDRRHHLVHQHLQPRRDGRRRLVARKARERGLSRKPWVKTSLAPGPRS